MKVSQIAQKKAIQNMLGHEYKSDINLKMKRRNERVKYFFVDFFQVQWERQNEKSRLDNMFRDTSPEILGKKLDKTATSSIKNSRTGFNQEISADLNSSYWRLKNQGDSNFDAKTVPMKKKKVDLIVNAYSRDFLREKEQKKYFQDLQNQRMEQKRRREEMDRSMRAMDQKDVRNKVKYFLLNFER